MSILQFELTNNVGLLTDELEYDDFGKVLAAAFVGDAKSMWIYSGSSPNASCHSMAAPTEISRWRRRRMKYVEDPAAASKRRPLTAKQLAAKQYYGLKHIDWFQDEDELNEEDDDAQKARGGGAKEDGSVSAVKTLANIGTVSLCTLCLMHSV